MVKTSAWLAGALASAAVLFGPAARAADSVCSTSYEQTQMLMRDGKLQAAREQAVACLAPACPAFTRPDCVKWLGEIDASQPSVVFQVRDKAGADTNTVRIALDGKAWLTALDGKAQPIDPGAHTVGFAIDGAPPIEQQLQILQGEKNRKVAVSFAPKETATPGAPATGDSRTKRTVGFVVGGVGVAALAAGGIVGAMTLGDASHVNSDVALCGGPNFHCTPAGKSALDSANTTAGVATALIPVGAVALGVGVFLVLTSGPSKTEPATVGLELLPGGAALRGRF